MQKSVLIVDDEPDICETISDIIFEVADVVYTAHSVKDALKIIDEKEIRLVISDIMMPELDGIAFLHALRDRKFPYSLVFVSASDSDAFLSRALELGAADFIAKPFVSSEVRTLVNRLLQVSDIVDQTGTED